MIYLLLINEEKDRTVFERIYRECGKELFYSAFSIVQNREDAEDVFQESFLYLIRYMDRRNVTFEFGRTFMNDVVRWRALNFLESGKNRRTVEEYDDETTASKEGGPDEKALDRAMLENIVRCIAALPPDSRTVLRLRLIDGMSFSEIAGTLKISQSAAKKRFERARKKLIQMLSKGGGPE